MSTQMNRHAESESWRGGRCGTRAKHVTTLCERASATIWVHYHKNSFYLGITLANTVGVSMKASHAEFFLNIVSQLVQVQTKTDLKNDCRVAEQVVILQIFFVGKQILNYFKWSSASVHQPH